MMTVELSRASSLKVPWRQTLVDRPPLLWLHIESFNYYKQINNVEKGIPASESDSIQTSEGLN